MARALSEVPIGTALLLDANIFIYALVGESADCQQLIERCRNEELTGITTTEVVGEVCHRLMIMEAIETGLVSRPAVSALRANPEAVSSMNRYWELTVRIFRYNLLLLTSSEEHHRLAQEVRNRFGLLTNDSLLVAAALHYGIGGIATRDADFDRISDLAIYSPTDLPANK
jgi:predicted nucleic acid-binding protein